jgi:hypothetical protein
VLHPEYKMEYFEKHWGNELTVKVTQTVKDIVCNAIYRNIVSTDNWCSFRSVGR